MAKDVTIKGFTMHFEAPAIPPKKYAPKQSMTDVKCNACGDPHPLYFHYVVNPETLELEGYSYCDPECFLAIILELHGLEVEGE